MAVEKYHGWYTKRYLSGLNIPYHYYGGPLYGIDYPCVYRMPNNRSTYSYKDKKAMPPGSTYYVNYSAARLALIASVSSTLSTWVISAAMVLFSYSLAQGLARKSDKDEVTALPSPYQLVMLVKLIDGQLMALLKFLPYLVGS
jgi:hypothetical protein